MDSGAVGSMGHCDYMYLYASYGIIRHKGSNGIDGNGGDGSARASQVIEATPSPLATTASARRIHRLRRRCRISTFGGEGEKFEPHQTLKRAQCEHGNAPVVLSIFPHGRKHQLAHVQVNTAPSSWFGAARSRSRDAHPRRPPKNKIALL